MAELLALHQGSCLGCRRVDCLRYTDLFQERSVPIVHELTFSGLVVRIISTCMSLGIPSTYHHLALLNRVLQPSSRDFELRSTHTHMNALDTLSHCKLASDFASGESGIIAVTT